MQSDFGGNIERQVDRQSRDGQDRKRNRKIDKNIYK